MRWSAGRHLMNRCIAALACIALILQGGCHRRESTRAWNPTMTFRPPLPSIKTRAGRLDVRFPPIPLSELGCRSGAGPDSDQYTWGAIHNFPDVDRSHDHGHNMGIVATFQLAGGTPVTETRLDSALASAQITVSQHPSYRGPLEGYPAVKSWWIRREGDRVHLRVDDDAAVRAFLQPDGDDAFMVWCQRDGAHGFAVVPIDRR